MDNRVLEVSERLKRASASFDNLISEMANKSNNARIISVLNGMNYSLYDIEKKISEAREFLNWIPDDVVEEANYSVTEDTKVR